MKNALILLMLLTALTISSYNGLDDTITDLLAQFEAADIDQRNNIRELILENYPHLIDLFIIEEEPQQTATEKPASPEIDRFLLQAKNELAIAPFTIESTQNFVFNTSPRLGVYTPEEYRFRKPSLIMIDNDLKYLYKNIPDSLLNAISNQLGISGSRQEKIDALKQRAVSGDLKVIFNTNVTGPRNNDSNRHNVAYHNVTTEHFNQPWNSGANYLMGIFSPNGITQSPGDINNQDGPIAFNAFTNKSVNPHDEHYSPNNAYFEIQPNKDFVSFWTAIFSQDKKELLITFNIMLENKDIYNQVSEIAEYSFNLNRLIEDMPKIIHDELSKIYLI